MADPRRAEVDKSVIALATLFLAASLQASPHDIVRQELVVPEVETLSLAATCFSRTFSLTITNHRLRPSALTDVRLKGRPPRNPESVASLRQFLAAARLVHITGATCVSRDEISIGLSGLLFAPPSGQRDDVMRVFRIRF